MYCHVREGQECHIFTALPLNERPDQQQQQQNNYRKTGPEFCCDGRKNSYD